MENSNKPMLHKLTTVSSRTGLSRSSLYREMFSEEKNPKGRLKVIRFGRAVRVREEDLITFINSLGN